MTRAAKNRGKSEAKAVSSQAEAYSTGRAPCCSMCNRSRPGISCPSCHSRAYASTLPHVSRCCLSCLLFE